MKIQNLILISGAILAVVSGCTSAQTPSPSAETPPEQKEVAQTFDSVSIKAQPSAVGAKGVAESLMVDITNAGKPVSGAKVSAKTSMPSMNMQGPELVGSEVAPGKYDLKGDLAQGEWRFEINAVMPDGSKHLQIIKTEVK